jgi:hypothetical protein
MVKTIAKSLNIEVQKLIPYNADSAITLAALREHFAQSASSFQVVYFSGLSLPFDVATVVEMSKARKTLLLLDCPVALTICARALENLPRYKDVLIVGIPPSPTATTVPSMALQLSHCLSVLEGSVPTTFGQVYDTLSFFRYRVKEAMPFYLATTALVLDLDAVSTHHPITSFEGEDPSLSAQVPRAQIQISRMECQLRLLEQIRQFPGQRCVDYARILSIEKKVIAVVLADLEKLGKVMKREFPTNPNRDLESTTATAKPVAPRYFPA